MKSIKSEASSVSSYLCELLVSDMHAPAVPGTKTVLPGMPGTRPVGGTDNCVGGGNPPVSPLIRALEITLTRSSSSSAWPAYTNNSTR